MLSFRTVSFLVAPLIVACGGKTGLYGLDAEARDGFVGGPEVCNGLDEDGDGNVDEDFRDELGRYVHIDHCAGCDLPCRVGRPFELAVDCLVIEETAVCAATSCEAGYTPSTTGRCVPIYDRLCLPCVDDGECGDFELAACEVVGGERRCVIGCELGCPEGYACNGDRCIPEGGSCNCGPMDRFDLACALEDPEGNICPGSASCTFGELSECAAPDDVCDELDNDCDGIVDEAFRDRRGAYSVDIRNCGECGVDCTLSMIPEGDLICGGDPFAPSCVLACPDAADGIMPGDRIDADLDIANGCECTVGSLSDAPGPVLAVGEDLDVNCDGADGIVVESYYVAPDGDDEGPGSPTRPLRTISEGLRRAGESVGMPDARTHVFVASGSYAESLELPDGVKLHGGYRRDFLALDPNGFKVEVRAPADSDALGGAALTAVGVGGTETVVEWITLIGRDAAMASSAAFGVVLTDPGPRLRISEAEIRSGAPGSGMNGLDGAAGASPTAPAAVGEPPRGAVEDGARECIPGSDNVVEGGGGGANLCGGTDVSGGRGGSPSCPEFAERQPGGMRGQGPTGGVGGNGGQDSQGPITGFPCPVAVCCGLADFSVPTAFEGPQSGTVGGDGSAGAGGAGCSDALGRFVGEMWTAATASNGSRGKPGSGGGGGGAGGGTEMNWMASVCEFVDGLGGGGGGGGAGGCGGLAGSAGTSGGPSVAMVVTITDDGPIEAFTMRDVVFRPADGGRGGDGGSGGDGGRGGVGALGGEVPRDERSIPTLAGPFPGGRGGRGGSGGPGGGGGGGCGGGSIGVWVTGNLLIDVSAWRANNDFQLGVGGMSGRGGGGGAPGSEGAEGGANDVLLF